MKKIYIIALFLVFCMTLPANATQYTTAYCTPAFDVSSKGNQVFSKVTGATFFAFTT